MAWRFVKAWVPNQDNRVEMKLAGNPSVQFKSCREVAPGSWLWEAIIPDDATEEVIGVLNEAYGASGSLHVIVQSVEAIAPRPAHEEVENSAKGNRSAPMSVEELLETGLAQARNDPYFAVPVMIASLVAATGVIRDSTELIVGSMVIAPLLGPSMAFAIGTTLGDIRLIKRAVASNLLGIACAVGPAVIMGMLFRVDSETAQVAPRITLSALDFVVAVAAGVVSALAVMVRSISSVVGVMIAVALIPPLVVTGMLIGAADFFAATGAALLSITNLICINLAAVVTLRVLHVRPRDHATKRDARKAVAISIVSWLLMLGALVALMFFFPRYRVFP